MDEIESLPMEMILHIFSFIHISHLQLTCRLVCKRWGLCIENLNKAFPISQKGIGIVTGICDWREVYRGTMYRWTNCSCIPFKLKTDRPIKFARLELDSKIISTVPGSNDKFNGLYDIKFLLPWGNNTDTNIHAEFLSSKEFSVTLYDEGDVFGPNPRLFAFAGTHAVTSERQDVLVGMNIGQNLGWGSRNTPLVFTYRNDVLIYEDGNLTMENYLAENTLIIEYIPNKEDLDEL